CLVSFLELRLHFFKYRLLAPIRNAHSGIFLFKQKTAYEFGLGIPAEPLFRSIQSATSRQNTKDQVYAQNEMLAYQQKESTARVASIMENTNLSKQQQVSEIMRQMLTQAQTAGQYFTNDQIK